MCSFLHIEFLNLSRTATQILGKKPSTTILFTTAYESIKTELPKHHDLNHKNIQVLLKPAKLFQIEDLMLDMVNN